MTDQLARMAGPTSVSGTSTLFTVPASSIWSVNSIVITNPSVADAVVKIGINGVTDDRLVLPATTVLMGGFTTFDSLLIFGAGDSLVANVTGAVTITVSGLEQN